MNQISTQMKTRALSCLLATGFCGIACDQGTEDDRSAQNAESLDDIDGQQVEVPGVGLIKYETGVRTIATVNLAGGGAVHFVESDESAPEQGHGCAGFFPANAPGEPSVRFNASEDGCLGTFLKMTTSDTPVPAGLVVDDQDLASIKNRAIVARFDKPLAAADLPFTDQPNPVAGGSSGDSAHSCSGTSGGSTHWETYHCDEGGADHCDPLLDGWLEILSGATYKGSYQTGLFCGAAVTNAWHWYYDGVNWYQTLHWSHAAGVPSNAFIQWSTWVGAASWRRQINVSQSDDGDFYHSYTKMCQGSADCPTDG